MKKVLITTIFATLAVTFGAQTADAQFYQNDPAIRSLAVELAKKLSAERAQTVTVNQFTYLGGITMFNSYFNNQLTGELLEAGKGSFSIVSGGGAQYMISGEIVPIAQNLRIYTRLVRWEGGTLVSQIHTDLAMDTTIASMLASGGDGSAYVPLDEWEEDSIDAPVDYASLAGSPISRTIHAGDEDWFVISADEPATLIVSTTGDMDTRMTFFDAETQDELASNDDGGNGGNALISQVVRPGRRYLVMVSGYSDENTGTYGLEVRSEAVPEPEAYPVGDFDSAQWVAKRLDGRGGSALFLLTPARDGEMVMETHGNSDVFMELFDAETYELLASDDDGGGDGNAMITYDVQRGESYVAKVRGYSAETTGSYRFKAYMEDWE